jgi:hypothetical protein
MRQTKVIEQRAVHAERVLAGAAEFAFGDEGPVVLAGAIVDRPWKAERTAVSCVTPRSSNWRKAA